MSQRIKGQEVEIVELINGTPRANFAVAKSFEFTFKTELLQEGYLGETTDRYDTIYKGISGKIEFHMDSPAVFDVVRQIVNKARRREAGNTFNLKGTLNFPSGRRARVVIPGLEFGPLPFNFGSRSDYGVHSHEFGASDARVLPI